ncbi:MULTISPECIES: hypothetical protein [unclassified Nocardioides]|uniref:hypothetical protein n=1 Tax=unclassified Nocardioides TaxID=2615069 RepID=UPI0006F2B68A|nr:MULTISPECIES: hypothetical protein [unclassified Nocardioides]KQY56682.1 hypothetical protein ASD30_10225 [Nocardioides sp. Root140]KQZ67121.1 hypothetical protein ASD66_19210 [Nocardioides sp. Root151]
MSRLIEVWGDTVDSRHMTGAIALGIGIATPTFLLGRRIFESTVDDQTLAQSYALLVGLGACLVAAVISARLFKPKRVVTEVEATLEGRRAALDAIAAEGGEWTDPAELAREVQEELRSLGLYDVLVEAHRDRQEEVTA